MALQFVGSTSGTGTANYNVSLSGTLTGGIASSPATGDIVIVVSSFGNTAAVAPTITGNVSGAYTYFNAAVHVNDTYDTEFVAGYRVMGGSVDTSLSITRTSNAAYGGATVVFVYRGQSTTAPIYASTAYTTKTNGAYPNITNVNVAAIGDVVLAMGAGTQPSTGAAFTVPAELTGNSLSVKSDGTTADIGVWMADVVASSTGNFTISPPSGGTSNSSCSGAAHSIALSPEPVTTTGTLDAAETGADTFAASGAVAGLPIVGTVAATESIDTAAASGAVLVQGGFAASEAGADVLASAGAVPVQGEAAASETGADAFAASGTVSAAGIVGNYDASESGADVFVASGTVAWGPITGELAAVEGADIFAASGTAPPLSEIVGTVAATEDSDTFSAVQSVAVAGQTPAGSNKKRQDKRRKVIVDGVMYEVPERDLPALLEAKLLNKKEPVTAKPVEQVKQDKQAERKSKPVMPSVQETVARYEALSEQVSVDVRKVLDRVAMRVLADLEDEEESAALLLLL